jgi:hypothetical protein
MTHQEAYNTAVKGLAGQGFLRSVGRHGCMYRGNEGRKCAVGHLIPDSQYNPAGEASWGLGQVMEDVPALRGLSYEFLHNLQKAHDKAYTASDFPVGYEDSPGMMKLALIEFGQKYELTIPPELK